MPSWRLTSSTRVPSSGSFWGKCKLFFSAPVLAHEMRPQTSGVHRVGQFCSWMDQDAGTGAGRNRADSQRWSESGSATQPMKLFGPIQRRWTLISVPRSYVCCCRASAKCAANCLTYGNQVLRFSSTGCSSIGVPSSQWSNPLDCCLHHVPQVSGL